MIEMNCPKCAQALHIEERYAGTTGKCNRCGDSIQVPSAPAKKRRAWKLPIYAFLVTLVTIAEGGMLAWYAFPQYFPESEKQIAMREAEREATKQQQKEDFFSSLYLVVPDWKTYIENKQHPFWETVSADMRTVIDAEMRDNENPFPVVRALFDFKISELKKREQLASQKELDLEKSAQETAEYYAGLENNLSAREGALVDATTTLNDAALEQAKALKPHATRQERIAAAQEDAMRREAANRKAARQPAAKQETIIVNEVNVDATATGGHGR